ncbi:MULTISPECIES: ATP-binding protein [Streptomyces]|uniref:ATP-binding protein n=1 Tax=Streptomyces TaxID=1883 RepID=UPI000899135A|nr:ATP-binding protein [Streptomyces sp. PAN_FS17]SEB85874.1 hypothetical protein SAMN05216482_1203 [Streptomyces sp. PAN_FS17]
MQTPSFVGRTGPLAAFTGALHSTSSAPGTSAVLYAHGPAGIGRTALLHRFAALARAEHRHVVEIDAAHVTSAPALTDQAREAATRSGSVLLVDGIEHIGADDTLPGSLLSARARGGVTVVAGTDAPPLAWRTAAAPHGGLRALPLGPLPDAEARELLSGLGLAADAFAGVLDFAQGHPLALVLAAAASAEGRFEHGAAPQELVLALLDHLLGDVPGPAHRRALEVAAHSRWTTEDLLRTALTDTGGSPADVFDWLRRRPYVRSERNGVSPIAVVRGLLDADLRWRDPSAYRSTHECVRAHLLDRMRQALPYEQLPATLAFTHLHRRNGFVSRFVTWRGGDRFQEMPYRPQLRADVLRFITSAEGSTSAAEAAVWLDAQPRAFRLYWDTVTREPAAVLAWLRLDTSEDAGAHEPLARAARQHARTRPLRPREHLALARVHAPASAHHAASPLMDLVLHRILATFMLATPAWSFVALPAGSFLDPLMRYIDQRPVHPAVPVADRSFTLYAHDWRAVTLERWMEVGHLAELAGPEARPAARPRRSTGALTVLTREEFDTAVGDALAAWQRADLLARNPLLRTRLVADRGGDDPVEALRGVVTEALDALACDPRAEKYHRAVVTGLLRGAPTREAAAERLGLPLSTFRRHLSRGLERVRSFLWAMESAPQAAAPAPPVGPEPAREPRRTAASPAPRV